MSVTLKDIAEAAGVSVGTVDRALHNRGRINAEVQKRILFIAEKMNYRTNYVARSLAAQARRNKIAVVLHIMNNEFFGKVLDGITSAAEKSEDYGISLEIYHCPNFDADKQLVLINRAVEGGASALIIVPIEHPSITKRLLELYEQNFPVIFLCSVLPDVPCFSSVSCNYYQSGAMAAGILRLTAKSPGKCIAFTPSLHMVGHQIRLKGIQDTISAPGSHLELTKYIELTNDSFECYYKTLETLKESPDVSYVIYGGGSSDAGLKAISDCGHSLHAVFYDLSQKTVEALNSGFIDAAIAQDPFQQGYQSVIMLRDYWITGNRPPEKMELENQIIIKENFKLSCI